MANSREEECATQRVGSTRETKTMGKKERGKREKKKIKVRWDGSSSCGTVGRQDGHPLLPMLLWMHHARVGSPWGSG